MGRNRGSNKRTRYWNCPSEDLVLREQAETKVEKKEYNRFCKESKRKKGNSLSKGQTVSLNTPSCHYKYCST
jgi:hypothetical protein